MIAQKQAEAYVADAVARVHASCGHGPLIFGCAVKGQPYVWCRKCGRSFFTVEGLKKWASEVAQKGA